MIATGAVKRTNVPFELPRSVIWHEFFPSYDPGYFIVKLALLLLALLILLQAILRCDSPRPDDGAMSGSEGLWMLVTVAAVLVATGLPA